MSVTDLRQDHKRRYSEVLGTTVCHTAKPYNCLVQMLRGNGMRAADLRAASWMAGSRHCLALLASHLLFISALALPK